jgi:hypothetical protein
MHSQLIRFLRFVIGECKHLHRWSAGFFSAPDRCNGSICNKKKSVLATPQINRPFIPASIIMKMGHAAV